MTSVGTTKLIGAAATLGPADRALLNLWVHRGLDDSTLAGLSHLSVDAIEARRRTMIERLSADLELPPESVGDALQKLASSNRRPSPPRATAAENVNGHRRSRPEPEPENRRSRRRRPLIAVGLVFAAVLVRGARRSHRGW